MVEASLSIAVAEPRFAGADWLVLGGYFLLLVVTGIALARRKPKHTTDYFLAGRSMPAWAVAISVLATGQSAATFLGAPQSAYRGDLTYLSANIGQMLAALLVACLFIPALYRCRAATVYQLLQERVGAPARTAASCTFMAGRLLASAARLFMGALAGSMILFGDIQPGQVNVAIAIATCIGIVYTLTGGIRAVIWTDVIQALVYIGAAVAAVVVLIGALSRCGIGFDQMIELTRRGMPDGSSKLRVVQVGWGGIEQSYTLWTALIGFTILNLGFYGTDQDAMQRMLTCRSAWRGAASMIVAVLVSLPVTLLFMVIGLLLWLLNHHGPHTDGAGPVRASAASGKVFLEFILYQMPTGLGGLMMAGLFAAGLSSLNSALNALASTFVNDLYRKWRPGRDETHLLHIGRIAVVGWGVLLGSVAVFCVWWHEHSDMALIDFALLVMAFAYAGLVGVFLIVLLTGRGSNFTVTLALIVGFLAVVLMQPPIWQGAADLLTRAAHACNAHRAAAWFGRSAAVHIAFPWQLTIATALASLLCALGRRHRNQPEPHPQAD